MVSLRSSAEGAMQSLVSVILRSASVTCSSVQNDSWAAQAREARPLRGPWHQGQSSAARESRSKTLTAQVSCRWLPALLCPTFPDPGAQHSFGIISGHVSDCSKGSPLPTSAQPWPQGFSGESPTPWKSGKILVGRWRLYRDFISYKLK